MPDYPYLCLDCKKRFSVFLSYAEYESAAVTCPHCGSETVERRLGRVRFASQKRTGWMRWPIRASWPGSRMTPRRWPG